MSDNNKFYNPYAFIPFPEKAKQQDSYESIQSGQSVASQHKWHKGTLSGAIFLSLKNHTPLVVGSHKENKDGKEVVKFFRDHISDQLAIPANSIRGMITSTAEILSDSAARVIEKQEYSVRENPGSGALSAIGILHKDVNGWSIEPVTLGTLRSSSNRMTQDKRHYSFDVVDRKLKRNVLAAAGNTRLNWQDYLKVNVKTYHKKGENLQECENPLQSKELPQGCFHGSEPEFVYVYSRSKFGKSLAHCLKFDDVIANYYHGNLPKGFLNARKLDNPPNKEIKTIINEHDYENLNEDLQQHYKRFILFKVDATGRESQFVATKKYEYLLPYTQEKADLEIRISVKESLIDSLQYRLGTVCTYDKQGKYTGSYIVPKGWGQKKFTDVNKVMPGDLVYFATKNGIVTKLSYSSIWRKDTKLKNTDKYFESSELSGSLPWGRREANLKLSPVEQMFGVVEDSEGQASRNLASRVRFYDGHLIRPDAENDLSPEGLPMLRNPKLPCPAMYFSDFKSDSSAGLKAGFADADLAKPNGRKRYLANRNPKMDMDDNAKAETLKPSEEASFGTWIEFDNLLPQELDLLLASTGSQEYCSPYNQTQVEAKFFKQQLGMGKPCGYGQVELKVHGVLLKSPDSEQQNRYQSLGDNSALYTHYFEGYKPEHDFYAKLRNAIGYPRTDAISGQLDSYLPETYESLISKTAYDQLLLINDFSAKGISVHYPKKAEGEGKIYEWFVENDKANRPQILGSIRDEIKPLDKY